MNNIFAHYQEISAKNENGNEINIDGYGDALNYKIRDKWLPG